MQRRYKQILWLQMQLCREFPGLKVPDAPARDVASVAQFFKQLLQHEDIASSYILTFFVSCASQEKMNEYVSRKSSQGNHAEFFKSLLLDAITIKETDLKLLEQKAAELPDIERLDSADFMLFSESIYETTQFFTNNFHELAKHLDDCRRLLDELGTKLNLAAEIFGNVSLHVKKINYAKSQFPLFSRSNINLDLTFSRYKILFYNSSGLSRLSHPSTGKKLCEHFLREVRQQAQRPAIPLQAEVQDPEGLRAEGGLNRSIGQRSISSTTTSSSVFTKICKSTRSRISRNTPSTSTMCSSRRFTTT